MSQELSLFNNAQQQLPAHLQQAVAKANELNAAASHGTLGSSIDRISLKGSRFRIIEGGEEVFVVPEAFVDVVVLRANPAITKAYYGKEWVPGSDDAPDCHSSNGEVPDSDSVKKQHHECASCPQNAWGSKINPQTGADLKACSDSKTLCVVPLSAIDKKVYRLSVPPASMKNFGLFTQALNRMQPAVPYNAVVVRISFDTDASHPKIKFDAVRYLTADEYALASQRYEDEEVQRYAGLIQIPVTNVPSGLAGGQNPAAGGAEQNVATPSPEDVARMQAEQAAKAEAEAKAKAEAEAKAQAEAQQAAALKAKMEAEAAAKAQAEADAKAKAEAAAAAQNQQAVEEVANAWGGGGASAGEQQASGGASAWGAQDQSQTAAASQETSSDAQGGATFDGATGETIVSDNIDDILGAGWDAPVN